MSGASTAGRSYASQAVADKVAQFHGFVNSLGPVPTRAWDELIELVATAFDAGHAGAQKTAAASWYAGEASGRRDKIEESAAFKKGWEKGYAQGVDDQATGDRAQIRQGVVDEIKAFTAQIEKQKWPGGGEDKAEPEDAPSLGEKGVDPVDDVYVRLEKARILLGLHAQMHPGVNGTAREAVESKIQGLLGV